MKKFITDDPASYITALAMIATVFVRLSSKFGMPLSDATALELAKIIGAFGLAFIAYLGAHAHGTAMGGALLKGGLAAGAEAAEDEVKTDLISGTAPATSPPAPKA